MKIRTYKRRVGHMLHWYTEELSRRMPMADFRTIANRYRADDLLKEIQRQKVNQEPQVEEWKFPLVMHYIQDGFGNTHAHVILKEDWERENLLYLDFDQ